MLNIKMSLLIVGFVVTFASSMILFRGKWIKEGEHRQYVRNQEALQKAQHDYNKLVLKFSKLQQQKAKVRIEYKNKVIHDVKTIYKVKTIKEYIKRDDKRIAAVYQLMFNASARGAKIPATFSTTRFNAAYTGPRIAAFVHKAIEWQTDDLLCRSKLKGLQQWIISWTNSFKKYQNVHAIKR